MARYREIRRISSDSVRSLCIKESYYTRGDSDEYMNLLTKLCDDSEEITEDRLEKIAEDILGHSDAERLYEIYGCTEEELFENVLWQLVNGCCYSIFEKAKNNCNKTA